MYVQKSRTKYDIFVVFSIAETFRVFMMTKVDLSSYIDRCREEYKGSTIQILSMI